jgi:hypothetical protein
MFVAAIFPVALVFSREASIYIETSSLDQSSRSRGVRVVDLDPIRRASRPIRPIAAHVAERHRGTGRLLGVHPVLAF